MALSINKKKLGKLFALQLSLGIVLGQGVFAQSVDSVNETALNEKIVVEAQKMSEKESADKVPGDFIQHKGTIGILGEKDVMDVPFQQMNLTQKTVDTFSVDPSQGLTSVLMNIPSIRTNSSTLYHDFSIRGQKADGYQLRVNGIPGMFSQNNIPINFVENVEVTSGPGMGMNGVVAKESPGGAINLVTKRAGSKDFTRYTEAFAGRSSIGNYIDFSQRFGKNKESGIRINAAYVSGQTAIVDEKAKQKNIFVNFDHQSNKSSTNIFMGYRDTHTDDMQRYFDFSNANIISLPGAPKGKHNYAFNGEELGIRTSLFTLNHVQKLSDATKIFINTGYAYNNGYDYMVPVSSRLDVLNNNGDFTRKIANEPYAIRNAYLQIGTQYDWQAGKTKNSTVFAWDKDWYAARWGVSESPQGTVIGNLYSHSVDANRLTDNLKGPQYGGQSQYYGWSAINTTTYGKTDVMLGVHRHTASDTSSSHVQTKTSATSPLYGLVYKPDEHWSFFANHTESFQQGKSVGSGYTNKGDILDPVKTKSNELGVKYSNASILTSLSFFRTTQDAEFLDANDVLSLNGESKYKGIELSVSGKVAPKLNVMGGLMYLGSEYDNNSNSYFNGKTIKGTADWSAALTLEYEASQQTSVWTRMSYTGDAPIYTDANRQLKVPAYTVFDMGFKYKTHLHKIPVTINATIFNLFNKNYWMARPTYNYGILSNPRTFALSVQFEL